MSNFALDSFSNQRSFEKNRIDAGALATYFKMSITGIEASPHLKFAANPHWCHTTHSLIYVDISGREVVRYISRIVQRMIFDEEVSFAIPTSDTTEEELFLFVGLEDKIVEVNFTRQMIIREVAQIPFELASNGRFIHAKCSPNGTLYIGCVSKSWVWGPSGYLLRLCPKDFGKDFTLHRVYQSNWLEASFVVPNGLAWIHDDEILIMDSGLGTVSKYRVSGDDVVTSSSSSKMLFFWSPGPTIDYVETIFTLAPPGSSIKDKLEGITLDSNKKLWVSTSGVQGHVIQVEPINGEVLQRIEFPICNPSGCIFGETINTYKRSKC